MIPIWENQKEFATDHTNYLLNPQNSLIQKHILFPESQDFAFPQTAADGNTVDRIVRMVSDRLKQSLKFFYFQSLKRPVIRFWRLGCTCRISDKETKFDRLI